MNASSPASPSISTLASVEMPIQFSVKKCHQIPETALLPLPLPVGASSNSMNQSLLTRVFDVQEKGGKAVKPKFWQNSKLGPDDCLVHFPAHRQDGSSSAVCGEQFLVQTSCWNGVSTTPQFLAVEMFAFFTLMFNTNIPYVNLGLFPSAFPKVDTKNGISPPFSKIFRFLKIF